MTTQHQNGEVTQNGGLTRYAVGQETAPAVNPLAEEWSATGRISAGTIAVNMRTGEAETKSFARHNVADEAPPVTIMSSLKRLNGHDTVELEPGNPASRTLLTTAARMGLVRDGAGFQDVPSLGKEGGHNAPDIAAITAPQDPLTIPQAPALPPAEHFDEAEWQAFENDIHDMPQVAYDTTVAIATVACLDGTGLEAAATRLSRETGMEPARAAQYVEASVGMFTDVVTRAVAAEGVALADVDLFYSWCRGQRGLQNAIGALTSSRDVKPFQSMAREWAAKQARHQGVNA
jgi:hypothetical protein